MTNIIQFDFKKQHAPELSDGYVPSSFSNDGCSLSIHSLHYGICRYRDYPQLDSDGLKLKTMLTMYSALVLSGEEQIDVSEAFVDIFLDDANAEAEIKRNET